jgi:site-specific DNA-methyltransferase (adenine-specific)
MGYFGKCEYYFHQSQGRAIVKRIDFLDAKKTGVVIRNPQSYSIIEKIEKKDGNYYSEDTNFSTLVSPKHFFDDSALLTSNWRGYSDKMSEEYSVRYYLNLENGRTFRWIKDIQIPKHKETKLLNKVYIPAANGSMDQVLGRPFYGEPNSVCSQTYLVIGYDPERHNFSKEECLNIISYIKTRFFRYLVSIKKKTQNGPRGVYQFVPMQDFSKPWVDEELYKKYNLTADEIKFIESMIKPME